MAGGDTHWSADVPVSMPKPSPLDKGVQMQGFIFTAGGIAHDIPASEYVRLSTPDWQPRVVPAAVVFEDEDLDAPPSTVEIL